jgi:hypothetical protein
MSIVRLALEDQRIVRIADYSHCPWILPAATSVVVARSYSPKGT